MRGDSMKKRLILAAAALAAVLVAVVPAAAITDGALDGNGHPYVGLMVAQDSAGNPLWRCSRTPLSARVFVTAGHCTEAPAAHAEIWFQADVENGRPANGYPLTGQTGRKVYKHPNHDPNAILVPALRVVPAA